MKNYFFLFLFFTTITLSNAQYCVPAIGAQPGAGYGLTNVTLNTINCNTPAEQGYLDTTELSTNITIGANASISFTTGSAGQSVMMCIDLNQDNTFNTTNEIYNITASSLGGANTFGFFIPSSTLTGPTRMRIIASYNEDIIIGATSLFNPCGPIAGGGDVEDYTINFVESQMIFDSTTTSQPLINTCFRAPQNDAIILKIDVYTTNTLSPLVVSQFNFNTTITSSAGDLSNIQVWYTQDNDTFKNPSLFGSVGPTLGAFLVNGNQPLVGGKNVFWLTYDVSPTATIGNFVDASCTSVIVNNVSQTPIIQDPGAGYQLDPSFTSCKTKRINTWIFGAYQGIDFNCIPPKALDYKRFDDGISEGSACMSDADGNLLFYTNGKKVWNKYHTRMPNGIGLMAGSQAAQPSIVIPHPSNPSRYFIFTTPFYGFENGVTDMHPLNGEFTYSEVDMTLDGGLGDVIVGNKNTVLEDSILQHVTAVKNCNGTGYWVLVHKYQTNQFFAYPITSSGIGSPVVSSVGSSAIFAIDAFGIGGHGQLKFSPNGKKIAWTHLATGNNVELFDFDNSTGIVSNPVVLNQPLSAYAVCFSPDNTKLYVARGFTPQNTTSSNYLVQYDICAGSTASIIASRTVIAAASDIKEGMEIGPDGKIYCAHYGNQFLHVINNPNLSGLACNFQKNAFDALGGFVLVGPGMMTSRACSFGLPNMIQSDLEDCFVKLESNTGFTANDVCLNDTAFFVDTTSALPGCFAATRSHKWIFGDPASGNADTAYSISPQHLYTTDGNYSVSLIITEGCQTDTITKTIIVKPAPTANAGIDTSIIGGQSVTLMGSGTGDYVWTPSNGLSCTTCATPIANPTETTQYVLTITDPLGCDDSDTINVEVLCKEIIIPNVFSPNNDGKNDIFKISGNNCIKDYQLSIFDRWGIVVFETTNPENHWNGRLLQTGREAPDGTYYYVIKGSGSTLKENQQKGFITLIR